jgi:hypothetical protein
MRVLGTQESGQTQPLPPIPERTAERLIEPEAPRTREAPAPRGFHPSTLGGFIGRHRGAIAAVMMGAMYWSTGGIDSAEAKRRPVATVTTSAESAEVRELKQKIMRLVNERFNGDLFAAFRHYDRRGRDRALDSTELETMLVDAGVGNFFRCSSPEAHQIFGCARVDRA